MLWLRSNDFDSTNREQPIYPFYLIVLALKMTVSQNALILKMTCFRFPLSPLMFSEISSLLKLKNLMGK